PLARVAVASQRVGGGPVDDAAPDVGRDDLSQSRQIVGLGLAFRSTGTAPRSCPLHEAPAAITLDFAHAPRCLTRQIFRLFRLFARLLVETAINGIHLRR